MRAEYFSIKISNIRIDNTCGCKSERYCGMESALLNEHRDATVLLCSSLDMWNTRPQPGPAVSSVVGTPAKSSHWGKAKHRTERRIWE